MLLSSAPHIMWPLRFVMPHDPSMRPAWMIRVGLFLYDHLARREVLPGSRSVDLRGHELGRCAASRTSSAASSIPTAGSTMRAWWCSTRSTPQARGAQVLTRTRCVSAQRGAARLDRDAAAARRQRAPVRARAVVNAAGPWAESFLRQQARAAHGEMLASRSLRLVKGSHIVVPRCFEHDHAYIFQNPDKRIIFAIPYEDDFTLIGTTDIELQGEPRDARIDADETEYLCEQASRYFKQPVHAGRRGLDLFRRAPAARRRSGDPSAVTRDYLLERNTEARRCCPSGAARSRPFASWPKKRPTRSARMLGEAPQRLDRARLAARAATSRTGSARRSGPTPTSSASWRRCAQALPWLARRRWRRMARAYGSRIDQVLARIGGRHGRRGGAGPVRSRARLPAARASGRAAPTTCCGGAASWACTTRRSSASDVARLDGRHAARDRTMRKVA